MSPLATQSLMRPWAAGPLRSGCHGSAPRPAMTLTMVGAAATGMPFGRQGERPARESRTYRGITRTGDGRRFTTPSPRHERLSRPRRHGRPRKPRPSDVSGIKVPGRRASPPLQTTFWCARWADGNKSIGSGPDAGRRGAANAVRGSPYRTARQQDRERRAAPVRPTTRHRGNRIRGARRRRDPPKAHQRNQ